MPPNFNDIPGPDPVNFVGGPKGDPPTSSGSAGLKAVRSVTTLVAHVLTGILVGVAILFAFRNGADLNATNQHMLLCVIGYQFLMAQAILSLAPDSWTANLSLKHKRWVHWILQLLGSVLALVGCFIKILDKTVHWNSTHGQFALVSMVFTSVCLVNGLASMYAHKFRKVIPPIISRLTHICFGIVAIGAASFAFAYGVDKAVFRSWATTRLADTIIIIIGVLTTIVIINPFITFFGKLSSQFRN